MYRYISVQTLPQDTKIRDITTRKVYTLPTSYQSIYINVDGLNKQFGIYASNNIIQDIINKRDDIIYILKPIEGICNIPAQILKIIKNTAPNSTVSNNIEPDNLVIHINKKVHIFKDKNGYHICTNDIDLHIPIENLDTQIYEI